MDMEDKNMKKQKVYKYIGYNGTITSPVLLPEISNLEYYEIYADNGYFLTNGEKNVQYALIQINEIDNWTEKKLGTIE